MNHLSDVLFLDDDEDLRTTFADLVRTIFERSSGDGRQKTVSFTQ